MSFVSGPPPIPAPVQTTPPPDPNNPVRVLVVDDHAFFRRGLVSVLDVEDDIEIVGEAGDGEDAVRRASALRPDVVLMDVRMPRASGIDACAEIKRAVPHCKIVMLTISDEEADLFEAIKGGATGYLLKEIAVEELADAIRAVIDGQSFINPFMALRLIGEVSAIAKRERSQPAQSPAPELSQRENEVLRQIARGLSNREIGNRLFISENTVKNHVRHILDKLGLHSRVEAAAYAARVFDDAGEEDPPDGTAVSLR
ncbi:response regulator transcription factor [Lipingzhangella sp. LS1_29]|uniref:Response regulator transcription factor n=1 Tax=Lipingzhangella rawalii TaxID=2055835 RepID=A0ABU2H4E6_9ACTN|nr:response regulator transcription factor [Lipingzhangella rawalii]MDS1269867.1 response regulator transcription factor [Lipingzhangella rawalii]